MILNFSQESYYLKNKVGIVDFTKARGVVNFQSPRALQALGHLQNLLLQLYFWGNVSLPETQPNPKISLKFAVAILEIHSLLAIRKRKLVNSPPGGHCMSSWSYLIFISFYHEVHSFLIMPNFSFFFWFVELNIQITQIGFMKQILKQPADIPELT